jgi:hypothetical protein
MYVCRCYPCSMDRILSDLWVGGYVCVRERGRGGSVRDLLWSISHACVEVCPPQGDSHSQ